MKTVLPCVLFVAMVVAQANQGASKPYAAYLGALEQAEAEYVNARIEAKRTYLACLDARLAQFDLNRTGDFLKSKAVRSQRDRIHRQLRELTRRLKLAKTSLAAVEVEASHPINLAPMRPGVLKVNGNEIKWRDVPNGLVGATFTRHTWGTVVKYKLLCRRRGLVFVGAVNPVFIPSQAAQWAQLSGAKLVSDKGGTWNVYRARMSVGESLELTTETGISVYIVGDLRLGDGP